LNSNANLPRNTSVRNDRRDSSSVHLVRTIDRIIGRLVRIIGRTKLALRVRIVPRDRDLIVEEETGTDGPPEDRDRTVPPMPGRDRGLSVRIIGRPRLVHDHPCEGILTDRDVLLFPILCPKRKSGKTREKNGRGEKSLLKTVWRKRRILSDAGKKWSSETMSLMIAQDLPV